MIRQKRPSTVALAIALLASIAWAGKIPLPYPVCMDSTNCPQGQFCQKENCGILLGLCKPIPQACPKMHSPVCGCDGITYNSACEAHASGTNTAYKGPCNRQPTVWLNLWVQNNTVNLKWTSIPDASYTLYYAPYPVPEPIVSVFLGKGKELSVELPEGSSFYTAIEAANQQQKAFSNVEYFILKRIWTPAPGTTWQWQLTQPVDTSIDAEVFDVDLFETPKELIQQLKERGRKVICYFSAGSFEPWRPDADKFSNEVIGKPLKGWADERWLNVKRLDLIAPVIKGRLDLAVAKGCDGVEPDNIDAYLHDTGFDISPEDQLRYNIWLSMEAHKRGLSIGLKNDGPQAEVLEPFFDWALVEECFKYEECEPFTVFIRKGKAVFETEYDLDVKDFCSRARQLGFSSIRKKVDLDTWVQPCKH